MEWTDALAPPVLPAQPAPMQQHPAYGLSCAALGRRAVWRVLGRGSNPAAAALTLTRRWPGLGRVALVSRGPLWSPQIAARDRPGALRALVAHLRRSHVAVIVTPDPVAGDDPLAGSDLLALVTPMTLATLDLTGTTAQRRGRLHGKWRNRLVRAQDAGLRVAVTDLPPDPAHWVLRREAAQARARGYRRLPVRFAAAWAAVAPGSARLFTASGRDDAPVAAMLFLLHGSGASYHIGWSDAAGRATGAHNLLMWRAMEDLAAHGVTRLDLDHIDTQTAPGLARFKLGTGAAALALGATRIAAPGAALFARLSGEGRAPTPQATGQARAGLSAVTR